MILEKIVCEKRIEIDLKKDETSIDDLKKIIEEDNLKKTNSLYKALTKSEKISIIAEIKKASPSKGIICQEFNHMEIAEKYFAASVDAVSILTEEKFFLGSEEYLKDVRKKFPLTILRKDFIIDEWQIYQSKTIGADAILLIAAILDDDRLYKYMDIAEKLGLDSIVEVHDKEELDRVLKSNAKIIGINNRNLKNFEVDLKTTAMLAEYIPDDRVIVSESGIKNKEDIIYLKNIGVNAVLIGETFMRADSIENAIEAIRICT